MKKNILLFVLFLIVTNKSFSKSKEIIPKNIKKNITKTIEQDVTSPTVLSLYPQNQFSSFLTTENLVIRFSEDVRPNHPSQFDPKLYIIIRNETDNVDHRVISSEDVPLVFRSVFTINRSADFLPNKVYSVFISAGFFVDESGNEFEGIQNTGIFGGQWRFIPKEVSPAGISKGLELWLRTDKGLNVNGSNEIISWEDQSGNNNHATPVGVLNKVDDVFNFNPAVYFENGANAYFTIDLDGIKNSNYNIITVLQRDNSNTGSYILGTTSTTLNQGLHFGYGNNSTAALGQFGNDINLAVNTFNNPQISPVILRGQLNQSSGRIVTELRDDVYRSQTGTNTNPLTGSAVGQLGRGFNGDSGFEGYLAEVIVYSNELTDFEVENIYSYLAIKYGFTLQDSFSSTFEGDIYPFWNPTLNTSYNNNIVTIGSDKISDLRQSKSKSIIDGNVLTIEKPGIVRGNAGGIAVGNNNQPITFTSTNAPQGFDITNRKWLMQISEDLSGISMSFEIPNNTGNLSDYRLYFSRSDTEFTFSVHKSFTPTSISGDTIRFTNITTDNLFISGFDDASYLALAIKTDTAPRLETVLPENNAEGISVTDNLQITFNENVVKGSGNIVIHNASDDSVFETIAVNSANVTVSNATATINPTKKLDFGKDYYVLTNLGVFKDGGGNNFEGITNTTTWVFSSEFTGPAGIASGLQLWLKANEGVTNIGNNITQWEDQSPFKRIASSVNTPTVATNPINLNNAIHFDGTGAGFQITNGILGTNTYSDVWVYTVQNVDRLTTGYIFREDMADGNRLTAHLPWSDGYAYYDFGLWNGLGRVQTSTSAITINETDLWTLGSSTSTSTPSGFRKNISKNGLAIASNNTDNTTESRTGNNSDFFVGIQTASGGGAYHGDLAEMIVYTTKPTELEQQKIQSYLAIKYGITLDRTDNVASITEGNYLNSSSDVIWNAIKNADYNNNIAVITKDDGSVLQQNESKSVNSGVVLSLGKSGGITNDKDAIAIGSNNQPFALSLTNAPDGYRISNRVYKIQKTGTLDDIFFRFDIPDNTREISDYQVIMSSSPTNFTTGTTVFPATTVSGNTINVNNITTVDGNYYVLAEKNYIPTLTVLAPQDNSINKSIINNLEITFSENIFKNTGNITIFDATDDSVLETIDVNSSNVVVTNNTVAITPSITFALNRTYYIQVASTAFKDDINNNFVGITDKTTWNFSFSQNNAPTFTSSPIVLATENAPYSYVIKTTDIDRDNSTVSIVSAPSWLSLNTTKITSTFSGPSSGVTSGFVNGNATSSRYRELEGITLDNNGDIYVADAGNHRIRKINKNDGSSSTFSGSISGLVEGNRPQYREPADMKFDANGNLYIADRNNHRIRKVTPSKVTSTFAGSSLGFADDLIGTNAKFNEPNGIAIAKDGTVYVTDTRNHKIRKITPNGEVSTLAGSTQGYQDGIGSVAKFSFPWDIEIDSKGDLFVSDRVNQRIRKITPLGEVTTLAGSVRSNLDGPVGTNAGFNDPTGLGIDFNNNLYVADISGNRIRKVTPEGLISSVTSSTFRGITDGNASRARFWGPTDVVVDSDNNLIITDSNNRRIRKIVIETKLFGTPTSSDVGNHNIVLEVNDGKGGITQQSFTIIVPDTTAPTINSTVPINNATIGSTVEDLEITFSEPINKDAGNISIYNQSDDSLVETIAVTSTNVTIANNVASISPNNLMYNESYYINIDASAFKDNVDTNFAGISDKTTWAFTVQRLTNNYSSTRGGQWSDATKWSLGRIPVATDNAVITSGSAVSVDLPNIEVNDLTVLGRTIIRTDASITVNGDFSNSSEVIISSDATDSGVLIVKGNATGAVIYVRGGLIANTWSLVTPAVNSQKVLEFAQDTRNNIRVNTTPNPDRYAIGFYNDGNATGTKWQYFNANTNPNVQLDIATGYIFSRATDGNLIFTGNLEVSSIDKGVTGNQWNAIGNSFTAYYPINKNGTNSFLADNITKLAIPALYTWDKTQSKYVAITNLVTSIEQFLPPGQGFFVRPNASTTLLFDKDKRSLKPSTAISVFSKSTQNTPFVKLHVANGKTKVNTAVIFSKTATTGFDTSEDIENFSGANFDVNSHLIENSVGKNYTIQSIPETILENANIPINLMIAANTEVTISIEKTNFPEEITVLLEDRVNNTITNLKDDYQFKTKEAINGIGRFYLTTRSSVLNTESFLLSNIKAFVGSNAILKVEGLNKTRTKITLFDILGKKIMFKEVKDKNTTTLNLRNLKSAVYIVKLENEEGTLTQKVILD